MLGWFHKRQNKQQNRKHIMKKEFPFGINPAGQVPEPDKSVTVVIEPSLGCRGGRMTFDHPYEPIAVLVGQVKLLSSQSELQSWGSGIICNDMQSQAERITVTDWIPTARVLSVKLEKGALPISQARY